MPIIVKTIQKTNNDNEALTYDQIILDNSLFTVASNKTEPYKHLESASLCEILYSLLYNVIKSVTRDHSNLYVDLKNAYT